MNVSRHARASACTVRLACADGRALTIETATTASGCRTRRRRSWPPRCASAAELGGECEIVRSRPSGTRSSPGYRLGAAARRTKGGVGALEKLRVLIADDHPLFRDGMRGLLSTQPDIEVAGEATTGEEAVKLSGELEPDVVLMDVKMPGAGRHRGHPARARGKPAYPRPRRHHVRGRCNGLQRHARGGERIRPKGRRKG